MFTNSVNEKIARGSRAEARVHVIGNKVVVSHYECRAAEALKNAARRQARVFPCDDHSKAEALAAVLA